MHLSCGWCRWPFKEDHDFPLTFLVSINVYFIFYSVFYFFQAIKQYANRLAFHRHGGPASITPNYPQIEKIYRSLLLKSVGHIPMALMYVYPCCVTNAPKFSKANNKCVISVSVSQNLAQVHWVSLAWVSSKSAISTSDGAAVISQPPHCFMLTHRGGRSGQT